MRYFRILVEVDEYGNKLPSVALSEADNNIIIDWFDSVEDAIEWVNDNGFKLATLY